MLRDFRRHFGISAPRLAVRTELAWHWRAIAWTLTIAAIAVLIWWGFDFGRFLGGFDSFAAGRELDRLQSEMTELRASEESLRAHSVELEGELAVTKGAQTTSSAQALALQAENTQLKEELGYLRKLLADSDQEETPSIPRVQVERESPTGYRFHVLLVNGVREAQFTGRLQLQVNLQKGGQTISLTLPEQQPVAPLQKELNFKYYQSVEGTFNVPAGSRIMSVQARLFEAGVREARALHTLNLPS